MMLFHLAKVGYGNIAELKELDTPEFLDLVEFEQISNAIERHSIAEASRK